MKKLALLFLFAGLSGQAQEPKSASSTIISKEDVSLSTARKSQMTNLNGVNYVAVLVDNEIISFFFSPDPPTNIDDKFYQNVLRDAYNGKTPEWLWKPADKSIYPKSKPFYEYDGKKFTKLNGTLFKRALE